MKKFDKMFRGGGGNKSRERDFEKRDYGEKRFGGGDRERPQMHEAICSDCGKKCEVPFKPIGGKPIFCSQCFTSHREGPVSNRPPRREYDRPDRDRPRFQDRDRRDRRMFDATCAKCGTKFQLPFSPIGDKPVYCNECFSRPIARGTSNAGSSSYPQYKEQFDMLNAKLDRIIKALNPAVAEEKKEEDKKEAEAVSEIKEKIDSPKKAAKKLKKFTGKKPVDKKKKAKK